MSEHIDTSMLMTKVLVPRRRDDIVTRARLLDRLYDMVGYRLVLVTAPAGYGKTTLLIDFAADLEHPVCWYALDTSDRDPSLFLQRLILSLQRRFPGVGQDTARALEAGADLRGGAPGIVRMLVNEIVARVPQWFVLVLDDYHAVGDAPEIDAIVSNFVAYQRDQCMTVLASRTVPELPLIISFVARGGVGGLGQLDISFEPGEVRALFAQNYGTDLSPEEARELAEQFEGWVTGLVLTAHVRRQHVLQSWLRARTSEQPVYEYLAQEVFEHLPRQMQTFLLHSSVLEEMNPTLCNDILAIPNAAKFLDSLEAQNMFVTRLVEEEGGGDDGPWSRYHHLFREFLQNRFRRDDAAGWDALNLKAAAWFSAAGEVRQAVSHALAAGAVEEAARLMAAAAQDLYRYGQLTTLLGWRDQIPEAVLVRVPRLALYQCRAASKLGETAAALALSEIAERGYRLAGDDRGVVYVLLQRSEVLLSQGHWEASVELGEQALALIAQHKVPLDYEAHRLLGLAYTGAGDVEAGRRHLEQALVWTQSQGEIYDRGLIRTGLAHCLGHQGELERSMTLHREALEVWRTMGSLSSLMDELSDLAFHLYTLGRYEEAVACFREALTLCHQTGSRRAEAYVTVSLGEVARDAGALHPAALTLERGRALAEEARIGFLVGYSLEALGLVYRSEGRMTEAAAMMEAALASVCGEEGGYPAGRYRASLGVVKAEHGLVEEGLAELGRAIVQLERRGMPAEHYRAQLFRAWTLYLGDQQKAALGMLAQLLDEVPESLENSVFVIEADQMRELFQAGSRASEFVGPRAARLARIKEQRRALVALGQALFPAGQDVLGSGLMSVDAVQMVRVYGFGVGSVELDGAVIPASTWGAVTARHLLFYLLVMGARAREQIVDDLWPELSAQKAKAAFHTAKFRLNRALNCDAIAFDGMLYSVREELPIWFDVREFEKGLAKWQQAHDPAQLQETIDLYTGDFLIDCYMEWCIDIRASLRLRCLAGLDALASRLLSRRQYRKAAEVLEQALVLEPARETFHAQLMRAYALCGERSRALAQYERAKAVFEEQLAARPSAATVALYHRILQEEPLA